MNTFWVKMGGLAVVVVGLIILVKVFSSSDSEPKPEPKTIYDVWAEDDKRLRADPEPKIDEPPETEPVRRPVPTEEPEPTMTFKELSLEDEIQAQKLFEMAMFHRKSGRFPGPLTYKKMVDYCRQIIEQWPESEYAFKARRMLADIPERHRKMYNITDEEMGR